MGTVHGRNVATKLKGLANKLQHEQGKSSIDVYSPFPAFFNVDTHLSTNKKNARLIVAVVRCNIEVRGEGERDAERDRLNLKKNCLPECCNILSVYCLGLVCFLFVLRRC